MNKRVTGIVTAAVICLCLLILGKPVSAAGVSVDSAAYVNVPAKSLVLRFADFSDKGYTYTVTNVDSGAQIANGQAAANVNVLQIGLGENYQEGAKYKLVLKGKNNKEFTVYYLAGEAISGLSATKNSDQSFQASWKVSNGSMYQGYRLKLYDKTNPLEIKAETDASSGTATKKSISSSSLSNGQYDIYLVSYKVIKKQTYFGQGLATSYDYAKKPGKVTGLKAVPYANRATLTWNAVSGATSYTVYKSRKASGGYTVAQSGVTGTSCSVTGLLGGKKYYFKVAAVGEAGIRKAAGSKSAAANAKIPVVAGQVQKVKLTLNSDKKLAVTWDKTNKASGYRVYYKKSTDLAYKRLGTTKKRVFTLDSLDKNTKYNIVVYAYTKIGSKKYLSSQASKTITVTPGKYMNKNYNKLLASTVRTIGYIGKSKCVYTKKKYSTEVKTAFVNYKGYSSKTKYLIWISHYTQQVSIFEGTKGDWKMIRTFICATGTAKNHSPIGVSKISYKEPGWFYATTKELYVSHYWGRNSFHTRPLWNSGAVQNPTIGKPASHGCVRCYNQDAKYIYDKMPINTTVVSY